MEPLNDNELNQLLRRWEAPEAPQSLQIPSSPKPSLWQWLWSGRIQVPVPLGVLACACVAALLLFSFGPKSVIPIAPDPARPVDNTIQLAPPAAPKQDVTPMIAPQQQVQRTRETSSRPESAALAGFRPVSQFEPKVIGVVK